MSLLSKRCLIFTDDYFFYSGLSHLLKEYEVIWCNARHQYEKFMISQGGDALYIVDCKMFYGGDWDPFNRLVSSEVNVLWFTKNNDWNLFSFKNEKNFKINVKESLSVIRVMVCEVFRYREKSYLRRLKSPSLTRNEWKIMKYSVDGVSAEIISKVTGKNIKTIYNYQSKIARKFGFGNIAFFVSAYLSNPSLITFI